MGAPHEVLNTDFLFSPDFSRKYSQMARKFVAQADQVGQGILARFLTELFFQQLIILVQQALYLVPQQAHPCPNEYDPAAKFPRHSKNRNRTLRPQCSKLQSFSLYVMKLDAVIFSLEHWRV
jgi:hypothetical protein